MCSSPAHPASAPLDDLMTPHTSIIGNPVAAWNDEATGVSKGLLPQLIDVIHALTEGQDALSRAVRDALLEYSCRSAPNGDSQLQVEPSDSHLVEAPPVQFVESLPYADAETRPPLDRANEVSGTEWLTPVTNGEPTVVPENRDYNFFDELDARLADLHDAPDPLGNG